MTDFLAFSSSHLFTEHQNKKTHQGSLRFVAFSIDEC